MSPTPNRRRNLPTIAVLDKRELKTVLEMEFQIAVSRYAESLDYTVVYFRKSAAPGKDGTYKGLSPKGWPDLVLLKGPRMICFELKSETGRTTPEQDAMLAKLAAVTGVDCYVAKPRDAAEVMGILQNSLKLPQAPD